MPLVDIDGTLAGVGDISGVVGLSFYLGGPLPGVGAVAGSPVFWLILGGSLSGTSTVSSPSPILTYLLGGSAAGSGTVYDELLIDLFGSLGGSGSLTGTTVGLSPLSGSVHGFGDIKESVPLPMMGFGYLTAYMEVLKTPKAICPICTCLGTLSYGQTLGPGNLTLCICDSEGNRFSPAYVSYALYEVLRGGSKHLRGPAARPPVMTSCGCYYATGVAGDCGQPGLWCIVWTWQQAPGFPCECKEECFQILDTAMANPCDPNRKRKFGWNC